VHEASSSRLQNALEDERLADSISRGGRTGLSSPYPARAGSRNFAPLDFADRCLGPWLITTSPGVHVTTVLGATWAAIPMHRTIVDALWHRSPIFVMSRLDSPV
jgi:hypothetical protein